MSKRNRSCQNIGAKAATAPSSSEGEIRYVLPPRFAIVGEALLSVVNNLREAIAQDTALSGHEFVMPGAIFHHLDIVQRGLERLPLRVDGLVNDIRTTEEPDSAHIYRAAGRLEEVLLQWVDGFHDARTSHAAPEAGEVRDLLVGGVPVVRTNQVWSTDITYVRLERGFAYLVAVIDWYSRRVLSWRISNSMDTVFCVDCLEDGLREHCKPEVFNSDQGSQFTSKVFTDALKREGVAIIMDGRGRAYDNIFVERLWRSVKHEDVYLNG